MPHVFVYGTLKKGFRNHFYLKGQKLLGRTTTVPGYILVDLGPFPGLIEQEDGKVFGEVWEIDEGCLFDLDILESGLFERKSIKLQVPFEGQDNIECYFYIGRGDDLPYINKWTKK